MVKLTNKLCIFVGGAGTQTWGLVHAKQELNRHAAPKRRILLCCPNIPQIHGLCVSSPVSRQHRAWLADAFIISKNNT